MKPPRHYKSTAPDNSLLLARFQHGDELWQLYVRRKVTDPRFVNLKLVSLEPVPHKAGYWLGWHMKKAALHPQRNDDLRLIRETRPALHDAVAALLGRLSEDGGDVRLIDEAEWPVVTMPAYPLQPSATPLGGEGGTAQSSPPSPAPSVPPTSPATPLFHRGAGVGVTRAAGPNENNTPGDSPLGADIDEVTI